MQRHQDQLRSVSTGLNESVASAPDHGEVSPGRNELQQAGVFTISLDFELYWGVFDHTTRPDFRRKAERTLTLMPRLLDLFDAHGISATFATVGLLFARNLQEAIDAAPSVKPNYSNSAYSAYPVLEQAAQSATRLSATGTTTASTLPEVCSADWFAADTIALIASRGHEIASHTFAHVYSREAGMTDAALQCDLAAARNLASAHGYAVESLVFPRNQYTDTHADIASKAGFAAVRGNPDHWLYHPRNEDALSVAVRAGRLLDDILPVSGHNCHPRPAPAAHGHPQVLKASRFLRPWSPLRAPFHTLRLARIQRSMARAALQGEVFHLWWHPHNFSAHTEKNFAQLERVLKEFSRLQSEYGMECLNMGQLAASAGSVSGTGNAISGHPPGHSSGLSRVA